MCWDGYSLVKFMTEPTPKNRRTLTGIVVSDKMQKTVVVRVDRIKKHPKYERRYRVSERYKAHDEKGEFHIGERVVIEEMRPLSRDKRWRVVKKVGETTAIVRTGDESPSSLDQ